MFYIYRPMFRSSVVTVPQESKTIFQGNINGSVLRVRTMTYAELVETRSTWAKNEGWPSVRWSMPAIYNADPEGFYFLEKCGDNGIERVASISVVTYPLISFAFIDFSLFRKNLEKKVMVNFYFSRQ